MRSQRVSRASLKLEFDYGSVACQIQGPNYTERTGIFPVRKNWEYRDFLKTQGILPKHRAFRQCAQVLNSMIRKIKDIALFTVTFPFLFCHCARKTGKTQEIGKFEWRPCRSAVRYHSNEFTKKFHIWF